MNYQKIYDQLVDKRKNLKPLSEEDEGQWHHIIPRSFGGEEIVKFTIREHIVLHELLVRIYRNTENIQSYRKMVFALDMMYKTFLDKRKTHSRFVEKIIRESCELRKNRTKISNRRLKKTIWWDKDCELTKEMIDEGWEYGSFHDDKQREKHRKMLEKRIWITDGKEDKFIDKEEANKLLEEGIWRRGRINLPSDFRDRLIKSQIGADRSKNVKGKIHIHNIETGENRMIMKDEKIPEGWERGNNTYIIAENEKLYSMLYVEYKNLFYNFEKLKKNHPELKVKTNKKFLGNCRKYSKTYEDKDTRNFIKYRTYAKLYELYGIYKVKNFGFKGDEHSLLAGFRKYGLNYENSVDRKCKEYLKYYELYTKYGYDYLYGEYGCEVDFRYLCQFWDRRGLKYITKGELTESKLNHRREMIFQNWKDGGMDAALKYLNRTDTIRNRAVVFGILRRHYLKEYTEILKRREQEKLDHLREMANVFNEFGFEEVTKRFGIADRKSFLQSLWHNSIFHKDPNPKPHNSSPLSEESRKRIAEKIRGRKWVHKDGELRQVKQEDLKKFLDNGYVLGSGRNNFGKL